MALQAAGYWVLLSIASRSAWAGSAARSTIEMADAIGMAQHRDAGVVLDEAHQRRWSPGE